jgi:hypothetical protein
MSFVRRTAAATDNIARVSAEGVEIPLSGLAATCGASAWLSSRQLVTLRFTACTYYLPERAVQCLRNHISQVMARCQTHDEEVRSPAAEPRITC